MKVFTLRNPDGTEIGKITMADAATPEEVQAKAEEEVARLRAVGPETQGRQRPLRFPPPPPWRVAGHDPLDDELRCTHCGEVMKRRVLNKHLADGGTA